MLGLTALNNWYITVIPHFLPHKIQSVFQWTTSWVIILLFVIQKNVFSQYFPDCYGLIPRSNFIFIGFLQEARPASYYFIFLTFSNSMAHIRLTGSVSDREFILHNMRPTQTMPSLEVKNSKLNTKCTNIRPSLKILQNSMLFYVNLTEHITPVRNKFLFKFCMNRVNSLKILT